MTSDGSHLGMLQCNVNNHLEHRAIKGTHVRAKGCALLSIQSLQARMRAAATVEVE
jgi:hypothetical protein